MRVIRVVGGDHRGASSLFMWTRLSCDQGGASHARGEMVDVHGFLGDDTLFIQHDVLHFTHADILIVISFTHILT